MNNKLQFINVQMKKNYEKFFHEAMLASVKSQHPRFKHGSVVVHRNSIVGRGANAGWIHAEVSGLIKIENIKKKCISVFVVRVNCSGEFRNSRPCARCHAYMKKMGVSRVFYSTDRGFEKMTL